MNRSITWVYCIFTQKLGHEYCKNSDQGKWGMYLVFVMLYSGCFHCWCKGYWFQWTWQFHTCWGLISPLKACSWTFSQLLKILNFLWTIFSIVEDLQLPLNNCNFSFSVVEDSQLFLKPCNFVGVKTNNKNTLLFHEIWSEENENHCLLQI